MVRHHWFIRIRWLIAGAILPLLLIGLWQVPNFKGWMPLLVCLSVLALVNLIWSATGRALMGSEDDPEAVSAGLIRRATVFANAQMTVDLLLLTVILRYSGGIENPMSVFYMFHVIIAVLLLTPGNATLQGCWALLLYSALGLGGVPGNHSPPLSLPRVDGGFGASHGLAVRVVRHWSVSGCGHGHALFHVPYLAGDRRAGARAAGGEMPTSCRARLRFKICRRGVRASC